jgi:hypothetical protein
MVVWPRQVEAPGWRVRSQCFDIAPGSAAAPPSAGSASSRNSNGLTEDEGLRKAVILRAQAYERPSCYSDPKTLYINAATNYAEVLMRAAGCNNFPKCPMSEGQLDQVWRGNRSAPDRPVAEAMAGVHAAGGLSEKSFRGDVGRVVRVIAGADFNSGLAPECIASRTRSWTPRIRIRR